MPLPTIEAPKYEAILPSTGKKFTYRPYLVKEEKLLMIAMESADSKQIMNAIKETIRACTFGKLDPNVLPVFDIEYVFLKLRAKSVGEVSRVNCRCEKCEKQTAIQVNLDEISVDVTKAPSNKIALTEKVGVVMRWPRVDTIIEGAGKSEQEQKKLAFDIILDCIESIYDEKKVYPASTTSRAELNEFIESLNQTQFKKIQKYIEQMPKLEHTITFICSHCSEKNSILVRGLKNFF